jgi:hypothetical protein
MTRESLQERVAQVRAWLSENVVVPKTPAEISVSDIEFDWKRMSGAFTLALDGKKLEERFYLGIEITGRVRHYAPMFHSPMGVPASYAAVELDSKTDAAVQEALESIFPRVRAYGWHKDIDVIIDAMTSFKDRIIDKVEFEKRRKIIEAGDLTVSRSVDSVGTR